MAESIVLRIENGLFTLVEIPDGIKLDIVDLDVHPGGPYTEKCEDDKCRHAKVGHCHREF